MASTSIMRVVGPTTCLSVTASAHTAVQIIPDTTDVVNFVSCLNTGTVSVAIKFGQNSSVVASLPVDGTTGDFILPALMESSIALSVPSSAIWISAIGAAAGPSLCYFTPIGDQS